MNAFDYCFAAVVGVEGGFSIVESDPGNWTGGAVGAGRLRGTKFGISAAAYPTLDIEALTQVQAKLIYRLDYWNRIAGDMLPDSLALICFDAAVNQGPGRAARWLQGAVGVAQDGVIGPVTEAAVEAHEVGPVLQEIIARRSVAYAGDTSRFWLGWYRRLAHIAGLAYTMPVNL